MNKYQELQWVITKKLQQEALSTLFRPDERYPFAPERGFLGIIHPGNGVSRRTLMLRQIVPQKEGWVNDSGNGLSFDPQYFSSALDIVSNLSSGAGIVIVHSHFGPSGPIKEQPKPSKPDLYHEHRLLFQLTRALTENAPVASGILAPNGAWRIREYHWPRPHSVREANSRKFGIDAAAFNDAASLRIVSNDILEVYRYDRPLRVELNAKAVDSTLRLWGEGGQEILSRIRVGIAGLGGVGSILTEFLARLGVGELVLVDFDVVSEETLNRLVGARRKEVGKPKVRYAARIAKAAATAKNFIVRPIRESVAEWDGLRHLLDVDILMNAADSPFARQVLDHVAYAYAIPVIDGGTILLVESKSGKVIGKSQVGKGGPGEPCLECCGAYTQEDATMAREEPSMQGPDAYVQTDKYSTEELLPRAPSVISFNGLVASLMVQRMLSTLLGFPPHDKHGQQRYYIEEGILDWGPIEQCKEDCPKHDWIGLGDSHPVPVGIDPIWKQMRESFTSQKRQKKK